MPLLNCYCKCSKISTVKFRYLLRLFALDLTASDAARLTGLSVRAVNTMYLFIRRRLHQLCPVPAELGGPLELDESCFGPRRVRGKRGWGASGKTIVFGLCKRGGQMYTKIVPDCSKKTLPGIIRGKIDPIAMVDTGGWRGYDELVAVGFDRHYRVQHGHDELVQGAPQRHRVSGVSLKLLAAVRRRAKHIFLLHLKEREFRFTHRYQDLYNEVVE